MTPMPDRGLIADTHRARCAVVTGTTVALPRCCAHSALRCACLRTVALRTQLSSAQLTSLRLHAPTDHPSCGCFIDPPAPRAPSQQPTPPRHGRRAEPPQCRRINALWHARPLQPRLPRHHHGLLQAARNITRQLQDTAQHKQERTTQRDDTSRLPLPPLLTRPTIPLPLKPSAQ